MKLKRKILTLFLFSYLMAFTAPFLVMADEVQNGTVVEELCTLNHEAASTGDKAADDKSDETWYTENYGTAETGGTCGVASGGLFEKGDCTSSGQIITEITEPIAPKVTLDADTKIIDVYQGVCCIEYTSDGGSSDFTCNQTRNIYADSYANCESAGQNCQQRQWLIAKTGIGLLKLFVKQMYTWGAFAVGSMAVGTMILNGVRISMSGVSGDISEAKNKIFQAIAGIVLLFMSALILYTVNPDFFS